MINHTLKFWSHPTTIPVSFHLQFHSHSINPFHHTFNSNLIIHIIFLKNSSSLPLSPAHIEKYGNSCELSNGVHSHVVEGHEGGGYGCPSLSQQLHNTGDVGDLGGEGRGNTGLGLREGDACLGCLQGLGRRDHHGNKIMGDNPALTPQSLAPSPHMHTPYLQYKNMQRTWMNGKKTLMIKCKHERPFCDRPFLYKNRNVIVRPCMCHSLVVVTPHSQMWYQIPT